MVLNDYIPHQLWHRTALSRSVSLVLETVVLTVLSCWGCRVKLQYSWTTEAETEVANLVFHCYPLMIFEILCSSLSPQKTKEAGRLFCLFYILVLLCRLHSFHILLYSFLYLYYMFLLSLLQLYIIYILLHIYILKHSCGTKAQLWYVAQLLQKMFMYCLWLCYL